MKDNIVKTTFRGTENLGNGLPIDYLSDHLDSFDITVRFVSGQGWLGIILSNGVEVFRSGDFKSDLIDAIISAVTMLETRHQDLLEEYERV